jgi:protein required for attachment to host cells
MKLPKGATVAVADGEEFRLFRNSGDESNPQLTVLTHGKVDDHNRADAGHHSSSANPDDRQAEKDAFSTGTIEYLNSQVLEGAISALLLIAAPKALDDMRKHYLERLSAVLLGEIGKELTGHSAHDVEKAIAAA